MPALHGYITLKELSIQLGYGDSSAAVQRLRRQLRAKEQRCGENFLIRLGSGANSPLYVTHAVIRQFCPELVSGRDEVAEKLREYIRHMEERLVELRKRDRVLGSRVRQNRMAISRLEKYVDPGEEVFNDASRVQ